MYELPVQDSLSQLDALIELLRVPVVQFLLSDGFEFDASQESVQLS